MRVRLAAALVLAALGAAGTAHAQDTAIEGRVDRLEREMRAVQRKVFPGGAGATVAPQITPEADTVVPGNPASAPITDLTARVTSIEGQIASMTGQIEQLSYRLRQLEEAYSAYRRTTDARLKALEDRASSVEPQPTIVGGGDIPAVAAVQPPKPEPKPVATKPEPPAAKPAAGSGDPRAAEVAAVQKPDTGDAVEDQYVYGYRLWQAKLYPEARRELEAVATKNPTHRRASFARNLLGRAYLDAGAPSLAAVAFYENYKKDPNGERAPDSLYYLAQALVQLKKPAKEVCKVYTELTQLYGDRISQEMKDGVAKGRETAKCP